LKESLFSHATPKAEFASMFNENPDHMGDAQLVEAILKGDRGAQREFFERFSRRMFGVCLRYAHTREEAEDLLQEGFLKAFRTLQSFRGEGPLEGWLRRVMVTTALEHLRRQRLDWTTLEEAAEPIADPEIINRLAAADVIEHIRKLPDGYRTVFNLYAIEGYTHQEIAHMLDISEGTSKSQYARARAHLAKMIEEY
jgi:RNA polymerase sigma-70 factor (ECF subfamily)